MKELIIDIAPTGITKVEAKGFNGQGCADASKQIEIAIGGTAGPKKKSFKPEAFAPAGGKVNNRVF